MAHAIYLSDEEKRLLRDKGVYLAHCAQSNANLTSGIMPLRRNLENGLTCTIASDVAAGHTPAMNKQIALTIEISKLYSLQHDREKALTIGEGLYLATKGPGRFYGRTGSFEKATPLTPWSSTWTTSKAWNGRLLKNSSSSSTTATTATSSPAT